MGCFLTSKRKIVSIFGGVGVRNAHFANAFNRTRMGGYVLAFQAKVQIEMRRFIRLKTLAFSALPGCGQSPDWNKHPHCKSGLGLCVKFVGSYAVHGPQYSLEGLEWTTQRNAMMAFAGDLRDGARIC